jgi:4-amino-4-deoxy-L-arabinose transferase-like glycosyltransferase
MREFGASGDAARLPNLLYALITALAAGALARRAAGGVAGLAAAAAISTFLLSYQVVIWLATDAPLLATVSVALLGLYLGFYADGSRARLRGYVLMHAALAAGFLCKSAAAWMVPALALAALVVWERRWRELLRWELYPGLVLQAAVILAWVWFVYEGPDGVAHLKVFFWNNLVGRFVSVDAPQDLQYAAGHRNSPGKYLLELPMYLWPWTLLVIAAARRAWLSLRSAAGDYPCRDRELRAVRFAVAVFLPALVVLSVAATARNIYLAPALPGAALLLGWWVAQIARRPDRWDLRALYATAALLLTAAAVMAAALILVHLDSPDTRFGMAAAAIAVAGLGAAIGCTLFSFGELRRGGLLPAQLALLFAYLALLIGPASRLYVQVDRWQDLGAIARAVRQDSAGRPLVLFAADETTLAIIDLYARTSARRVDGPADDSAALRLRSALDADPAAVVLVRLTRDGPAPGWLALAGVSIVRRYALPHGRSYALLGRIRP